MRIIMSKKRTENFGEGECDNVDDDLSCQHLKSTNRLKRKFSVIIAKYVALSEHSKDQLTEFVIDTKDLGKNRFYEAPVECRTSPLRRLDFIPEFNDKNDYVDHKKDDISTFPQNYNNALKNTTPRMGVANGECAFPSLPICPFTKLDDYSQIQSLPYVHGNMELDDVTITKFTRFLEIDQTDFGDDIVELVDDSSDSDISDSNTVKCKTSICPPAELKSPRSSSPDSCVLIHNDSDYSGLFPF